MIVMHGIECTACIKNKPARMISTIQKKIIMKRKHTVHNSLELHN